jgi:hypothetical protein
MVGEFSAQKAPKSSGKRVLVRESTKTGQNGGAEGPGLRGGAEVSVYAESPLIPQPFRNVEPISISLAPSPKLRREDTGLYRESQLPDLQFELRTEDRSGRHETSPVGIAAFVRHEGWTPPNTTPPNSNRRLE